MKKIFLQLLGLCAIILAMSLNLSYAVDDYGISKNTLSFQITAQASTSGSSSNSGSGSDSDEAAKPKCKEDYSYSNTLSGTKCSATDKYRIYTRTTEVYSCTKGSGTCRTGSIPSGNTCNEDAPSAEATRKAKESLENSKKSC